MRNSKLMALIDLHVNLEGDLSDPSKSHLREGESKAALIQALKLIAKGTKLESETNAFIETCEKNLYN
ncbi:hypothetical protein ASD24_24415 [Paenibacillus sp. Root52]|uniref:hypothetical protein n=1 Tax=Paenibacillus sp. Root52 TaxID=1736552 RepID=UPI0006F24F92|nr:hypothetical protein [Paenibacillus sp. Root52]KQY90944.1 hypothetical protein ASD24_24415 [Paenibacillus sp. Root52]